MVLNRTQKYKRAPRRELRQHHVADRRPVADSTNVHENLSISSHHHHVERASVTPHRDLDATVSGVTTTAPARGDVRFQGKTGSSRPTTKLTRLVESRCGAVAVGCTYLFPPLSSGGALVVQP